MSPLVNYAQLPAAELEALGRQVARLSTLAEVIRWGLAQNPERTILEVVIQDEYCHDVVMAWRADLHLVFDTT